MARPARLAARFDAAVTNDANRRHWVNADDLAPDAACSAEVRRVLRQRGRYEQFNNPYTDGILQTLAFDVVGNGPQLQMGTPYKTLNAYVEREFTLWAVAVDLAGCLQLMIETRAAVGEVFCLLSANPLLPTEVKLNPQLIEPDQVATPDVMIFDDPDWVDGIVFDPYGNPREYHVLRQHPGDTLRLGGMPLAYDRIPAERMIHLYRRRRPGQRRGIPQITSSLPLFAERRGFRQSVAAAARVAAEMGAITIESETSADTDDVVEPFDTLEIERGMMTTLPTGWKAKQMEPVQPGTTFAEFDDKLINEAARPLNMPFNIAACNSSQYNYASGRLDHQTYDRAIAIDHGQLERTVLDRLLSAWLTEALQIPGYLPRPVMLGRRLPAHAWLWRGRDHVDPTKEADAQRTRLENLTTTLRDELAGSGKDLESHLQQLAQEEELLKSLGLQRAPQKPAAAGTAERETPPEEETETEDPMARRNGRNGRNGRAAARSVMH